jgi:hypothetical protein
VELIMTQPGARILLACVVGLIGPGMVAQQSASVPSLPSQPGAFARVPTEIFRGSLADLRNRTFHLGELTLTLDAPRWGAIDLRIENTAKHFLEVHPEDLSIVSSKKLQVDLYISRPRTFNAVQETMQIPLSRLAPEAYARTSFYFTGIYKEPFKVYFGENLLAEITD